MPALSPFVYWAQSKTEIFLKISLKDVKDPDIKINDTSISFNGSGTGAQGFEKYSFDLLFSAPIQDHANSVKVNDSGINITLTKATAAWWARLISTPQPSWLKVDFDKWQPEEEDLLPETVSNIRDVYPDVYKSLMKDELGYVKEDFKTVYMLFYNLGMLSAFLYALLVVSVTLTIHGYNDAAYTKIYPVVGHTLCLIHLFQILEIMHPMFGYVKGSPLMPFIQIFGRLFILFGNLEFEPRLQKMPATTWLFLVWIISDVIRYVYYVFHTSTSAHPIRRYSYPVAKWLRYSAWILLYPIGFVCESVIIFRNILYLVQSPRFYLQLPNPYNFTFDYLTFLRIYMLLIMFPGMYSLLKHMYKARVKTLGGKEPFDKLAFLQRKSA